MKRRDALKASLSFLSAILAATTARSSKLEDPLVKRVDRSSSGDVWQELAPQLKGRLKPIEWPISDCIKEPGSPACDAFFKAVDNPFFLGDHPALTQSFGWVGAWTMAPSEMVVEAETSEDVAAAVRFARKHDVRLVVKGGGHSYKGGSNAANSLLVWTRRMTAISMHDDFVPKGSNAAPVPAVSVGAGCMWGDVYHAVSVKGARYVQGGGCLTVGVAGLVQSGGFGSFSKRYGLAAAGLLEAEIVTADGAIRIVNAERDPELFFALKGGGGGTFGIVTRLTLRTHQLPATFGAVFLDIHAATADGFRQLIERTLEFYADDLFDPHWGEQIRMRPDNGLSISMVFQGLSQRQAEAIWAPYLDWVRSRPDAYQLSSEPTILAVPARSFWDAGFLKKLPGVVMTDTQPGAPADRIFWAGNREEAGQVIHAYRSGWLPADLLQATSRARLVDGLFVASRHWSISLHMNKGLAGLSQELQEMAKDTAINPAVLGAFALVICAAEGPPAYPGVAGREPDETSARRNAERVTAAMSSLEEHVSLTGAYLAESDYFEPDWSQAFWGSNYPRLQRTKKLYDPDGMFTVHHGVGSERSR